MKTIRELLNHSFIDCPICKVDMLPTGFAYMLKTPRTEFKCPNCNLIQVKSMVNDEEL